MIAFLLQNTVGNQTILDQTVLPIDFHWMDKQTELKNKNRNEQYAIVCYVAYY